MSKSCTNPHGLIFIKSWQISSSLLVVSHGMCEIIFAHFAQFLAIIVVTVKECLFWNRDILMCSQVILGKSCLGSIRDRFEFHEILVHRSAIFFEIVEIFFVFLLRIYI